MNPASFESLAQSALEAIGLPARPLSRGLDRVAKRMARVLGLKDLAAEQRLPADEARLAVRTFAASAAMTLSEEGVRWSERREFDDALYRRFGVQKFVIAAGKSSRFSPTELIHKQIARPDGSSTNLAQARLAARLGRGPDVAVVDPMVTYRFLARTPLEGGDEQDLLARVAAAYEDAAQGLDASPALKADVLEIVASRLRFARHPDQVDDFADVMRTLADRLAAEPALAAVVARALLDELAYAVVSWLVEREDYVSRADVEDYCGPGAEFVVARPYGPGEAYMAGVEFLARQGRLDRARYSLCIYSDYPAFLLDEYPNLYLHAYLRAVNRFDLHGAAPVAWPGLPVITVGAKQPADTVRDRGNVMLEETELGPMPRAIREWRDMSDTEREECEERFAQSRHAINAGLFFIDTRWARDQFDELRRRFDHPDPAKGKRHEFWYTDLVALAAEQGRPRRVLWLGERAPLGNKDVVQCLRYRGALHDMMRRKLLDVGVAVDSQARVNLVPREPDVDLDEAIRRVFGLRGARRRVDQVFLFGDVELDSSARVEDGVCLDGRSRPVALKGETRVGRGVFLRGVQARDAVFQAGHRWDGYAYEPPRFREWPAATRVEDARLVECLVQAGADIRRSELHRCYVAGRVRDSELDACLVAQDETIEGQTAARRRAALAALLCDGERYTPGARRLGEMSAAEARRAKQDARFLFQARLDEGLAAPAARERALAHADFLLRACPFAEDFTPELIDHFLAAELRRAVGEPARKRRLMDAARPLAEEALRLLDLLFPDSPHAGARLREIACLSARANSLAAGADPAALSAAPPAIDHTDALRRAALERGPGLFVVVLDSAAEALVDAALAAGLAQLGHTVLVAARHRPAGALAAVRDVNEWIDSQPRLRRLRGEGRLRVAAAGPDSPGLLLDRLSPELEAALLSDRLRAILLKGPAALATTCARNRLKAPAFALLSVNDASAERLAGVARGRTAAAWIPAGERVLTVHSDGSLEGSLRRPGRSG